MYSPGGRFILIQLIYFDPSAIYLLGEISPTSGYGAVLIKVDTGGNVHWSKKISRGNSTQALSMIKSFDNKLLIFGTDSVVSDILMKVDTSGNAIWSDRFYTGYPYPQPGSITIGGDGPGEGPGNIIELPDHSITLATNTIQPFSVALSPGYYYTSSETFIVATIIKTDANGTLSWAKKLHRMISLFPSGEFALSSVGDIFYTSDHNYLLAMGGNYTLKVDTNANVIASNAISGGYGLNFISEYPQGNINIAENGGYCCGDVIWGGDDFALVQSTVDFNNITSKYQHVPSSFLQDSSSYTTISHVRQLTDKRFACTGSLTTFHGGNNVSTLIITDPAGNENCTSQGYLNTPYTDPSINTFPASIIMDTGVIIQPFIVNDSLVSISHCNCDSLPKATFGVNIIGSTVYCTDSTQTAITRNWNFGDGSTDTARNPVHTYNNLYHTITLTEYNKCGVGVFTRQLYPSGTIDSTKPACNWSCSGYAHVDANSGTPPYTYSWNGSPTQVSAANSGLCPGSNSVTITDANNVSSSVNITVQSDTLTTSISRHTDLSCYGINNGSATDSIITGAAPFMYTWNNNAALNTATQNNLPAGRQIITITDATGCSINDTVIITQPALIAFTNAISNDLCFGDSTGHVNVIATRGVSPYAYTWDGDTLLNSSSLYGLPAGTHVLMVRDQHGCSANDTVTISQPSPIYHLAIIIDPSCKNSSNGSLHDSVKGGTPPYRYNWSTASSNTTATIRNLQAGTYAITIYDSNNCLAKDTAVLTEPNLLADSINVVNASCYGRPGGIATIHPFGGTPPYDIWENAGQISDSVYGLYAGKYPINIVDANNCMYTDTIHIGEPPAITIMLNETPDTGTCSGTAVASVTGGTGQYHYYWNNGDTTQTIINLCGKYYTVFVTDGNNCLATDSILVPSKTSVLELGNAASISIVPNPFTGYVVVSYANLNNIPFHIAVTDALGTTVSLVTVDDNSMHEISINTSVWVPGFYSFNIVDEQKHILVRKKMVKE